MLISRGINAEYSVDHEAAGRASKSESHEGTRMDTKLAKWLSHRVPSSSLVADLSMPGKSSDQARDRTLGHHRMTVPITEDRRLILHRQKAVPGPSVQYAQHGRDLVG